MTIEREGIAAGESIIRSVDSSPADGCSCRAGSRGTQTAPEFHFLDPEMEFGSPEIEFGTPEMEFAGQKMEFGSPEIEFGSPEMEFGT